MRLVVVGAGSMGRGMAEYAARSGLEVSLSHIEETQLPLAGAGITKALSERRQPGLRGSSSLLFTPTLTSNAAWLVRTS